ncbi:hypothetical protein CK203_100849 [Vitis vinifera]|uniref:Reverse transcriptase RNase H-like domain-containing protein n=1 Tax=Vitis vinifera TaxID=29760 RepID=A0A438DQP1_VITVI|nr:hypothetical protein CK203_100849 [Vitis vinifera]
MALGCMLAQLDDSGKERAIYHLSRRMLEYECKYIMIERLCLALVWATRRLRHYVTKYSILLVSRLDPLRYLFDRPVLAGRLMRWLVLLTEFDIQPIDNDFSDEQFVSVTNIAGWQLYFDGAANQLGFGIDILLISPQGDHIPRLVRLAFSDHRRLTNNIVEYEACITGLETTLGLGVRQLEIHGDSNLDELPWCHDIYQFLLCGAYLESASTKDRRALRSSDERGSCRSLWLTYGMTYVGPKDYEDRLFLVDHGGRLLPVPSEISPKSSSGHEYILVAVDYFTKWVEAASYARLTAARVAKFIRLHIIYRYGVLHELISNRGVHFKGEVDTFIQEATPYSLVYGMEAVLPVEIEMRSLRVALEQQISKTEWALSHYDQLSCGPAFFTLLIRKVPLGGSTPLSLIKRQEPSVKYPEKVEHRPDRMAAVRHPEKMRCRLGGMVAEASGWNDGCETSRGNGMLAGWNGGCETSRENGMSVGWNGG